MITSTASPGYANHERFVVGAMHNVDPSQDGFYSTSGACVPSHDRERLDCYFTAFFIKQANTASDLGKALKTATNEFEKNPAKTLNELKKMCSEKWLKTPDPIRLMWSSPSSRASIAAAQEFCKTPSRSTALAFTQAMIYADAKKCNCLVSDWRSTLLRQADRWIENTGPNGLCGVIKVFTLVPHDMKKMKEPTGPVLWSLHEKTVTTQSPDDKLCAKSLLRIEDGTISFSWDAPAKSIECDEFEFISGLDGMSDPRGRKGK